MPIKPENRYVVGQQVRIRAHCDVPSCFRDRLGTVTRFIETCMGGSIEIVYEYAVEIPAFNPPGVYWFAERWLEEVTHADQT